MLVTRRRINAQNCPVTSYCSANQRFFRPVFDVLYKKRYGALLGACDVIQDGGHIGLHLGFYQKLEIMKKRRKLEIVDGSQVKYE